MYANEILLKVLFLIKRIIFNKIVLELDDDYDDYDYDEEGEEPQSCIFLISIFGNIFFK